MDVRGVICPLKKNSTSVRIYASIPPCVQARTIRRLTSETTLAVHVPKYTHIVHEEAFVLDGSLEALKTIPGHVPEETAY